MKAAVIERTGGPFVVRDDLTLDAPGEREILVDVKASGLCHSDLNAVRLEGAFPLPVVAGHEVAGIVRAVGARVRDFQPGDHVVACLAGFCGHCDRCITGRPDLCRNPGETQRPAGSHSRMQLGGEPITQFSDISGFAEQVLLHENNAVVISKDIPFPQASILGCAVATGVGAAMNSANVQMGERVAVIGCGGVGLNVIQGAALAGARTIVAIDKQQAKLDLAVKLGATHTVNASDQDAVEAVLGISGGVDHSFEVIGGVPALMQQAVQMLDVGGTAYLIGAQPPGAYADWLQPLDLLMKKISLRGVYMGGTNFKRDIPLFADLYLQGRLNLDDLITQTIGIEDINRAYEDLESGRVARSVITSF